MIIDKLKRKINLISEEVIIKNVIIKNVITLQYNQTKPQHVFHIMYMLGRYNILYTHARTLHYAYGKK